jgi:hypothetical protein
MCHHQQASKHPAATAPHHTQASTPQNAPHSRALGPAEHLPQATSGTYPPGSSASAATDSSAHTETAPHRACTPWVCGFPRWLPKRVGQHQRRLIITTSPGT